SRTRLRGANLTGAKLRGARLYCTLLERADLRGADLQGADLRGSGLGATVGAAMLEGADLTEALYDSTTRWPLGFDPKHQGCLGRNAMVRAPRPAGSGGELTPLPDPVAGDGVGLKDEG